MNPYKELANAIVYQAVSDYRNSLRGKSCYGSYKTPKSMKADCEKFFRSDYFRQLTSINPEYLIHKLQEEYKNECNSRAKHKKPNRNNFEHSLNMLQ